MTESKIMSNIIFFLPGQLESETLSNIVFFLPERHFQQVFQQSLILVIEMRT